MTVIYRQLMMNDIASFTSQPKARFYDELFMHLNLNSFPECLYAKGRQEYSRHAMLRAGIVMKCECFEYITDLVDYLNNNLLIAYYCGYKCHILVDCMTGLPICEMTTGANVADSTVAIEMLEKANGIIPIKECTFIADKGYDVKAIYNTIREVYEGDCYIPLNTRFKKIYALRSEID